MSLGDILVAHWNTSSRWPKRGINNFELLQLPAKSIRRRAALTYTCDPKDFLYFLPEVNSIKSPKDVPVSCHPELQILIFFFAVLYFKSSWEWLRIWASIFTHPNLSLNLASSNNLSLFFSAPTVPGASILLNGCFSSLELFFLWKWTNPHLQSQRIINTAIKLCPSKYLLVARCEVSQM